MASALTALARLVRLVIGVIVAVIVAAILLRVFSANPANSIVRDVHDAGSALVGPFKTVFALSNPKTSIAVNWGLAAVVYLVVGGLIVRLLAIPALRGSARRWWGYRRQRGRVGRMSTPTAG